jgi:hypothetical protein
MKAMFLNSIKSMLFLSIFSLLVACNSKPYIAQGFKEKVRTSNNTIAVLPYHVIFQGRTPKNVPIEVLEKLDREERLAFQQSLFNQFSSRMSGTSLQLQSVSTTNSRLQENKIDLYKIENYKPEALAKILGVDMVVVPSVIKHRYRSDEASMALSAANIVIANIPGGIYVPYIDARTNDVEASYAIVNAADGKVEWSIERKAPASWARPVSSAMDDLHRRMTRKLKKVK